MKTINILIAALFFASAVLNQSVSAQVSSGTDIPVRLSDVPRIMSYQGQITSTNGNAMNGTHTLTATLYSDPHGRHSLGGGGNATSAEISSILGGEVNTAQSFGQVVLGYHNIAQGTSVRPTWDVGAGHASTTDIINPNDRILIVGSGYPGISAHTGTNPEVKFNAFEVSNNGHSIVYDKNGTGATRANIVGATYTDNTLNAWAHWKWNYASTPGSGTGFVVSDHGVTSIVKVGGANGRFTVTLNLTKPDGTAITAPQDLCVTVTPCNDGNEEQACASVLVVLPSPVTNIFEIDTNLIGGCSPLNHSFMMHVTGRY